MTTLTRKASRDVVTVSVLVGGTKSTGGREELDVGTETGWFDIVTVLKGLGWRKEVENDPVGGRTDFGLGLK